MTNQPNLPKLERLARELTSVAEGQGRNLDQLLKHIRDDSYDRQRLYQELVNNKLKFFAHKLMMGQYDSGEL